MPTLDFSRIGKTPDHVGRITVHVSERVSHKTITEQKVDGNGDPLYSDGAGGETTDPNIDGTPIRVPAKDDDGTTDLVQAVDGYIEVHLNSASGNPIPDATVKFSTHELPQAWRNQLINMFGAIRAKAATEYAARLGGSVKERK